MTGRPLLPFQIEDGLKLSKMKAALVAHSPRVGKSNCAIRACDLVGAKTVFIVCPANVRENWRRAIEEFRTGEWTAFIISYNMVGKFIERARRAKLVPDVVIIDESHMVKNKDAARTRHVYGEAFDGRRGLIDGAKHVYALSGTPLPNHPGEIWTLLRALMPELIMNSNGTRPMSMSAFQQRYCSFGHSPFGMKITGSRRASELRERMAPMVLRRTRKEVFGRDLMPPSTIYLRPTRQDLKSVESLEKSGVGKALMGALEKGGLSALKKSEESASSLRQMYGLIKVPLVASILADELETEKQEKFFVVAYHISCLDALAQALRKYGVLQFDGRTSPARKIRIQDEFKNSPSKRVLVGQVDAASVGLDFSRANNVVFVEQSWVPSTNEQAAARIFNVASLEPKLTRFACLSGTLDEKIAAACLRKATDARKLFS